MHKTKTIYSAESVGLRTWLADKRQSAGLTIKALADQLGWPSSIVGKIFTGDRRLDVTEYLQICKALNADAHEGLNTLSKVSRSKNTR